MLLCTDGLTRMVSDEDIREVLLRHRDSSLGATAEILVAEANSAGGLDNINPSAGFTVHVGVDGERSIVYPDLEFAMAAVYTELDNAMLIGGSFLISGPPFS